MDTLWCFSSGGILSPMDLYVFHVCFHYYIYYYVHLLWPCLPACRWTYVRHLCDIPMWFIHVGLIPLFGFQWGLDVRLLFVCLGVPLHLIAQVHAGPSSLLTHSFNITINMVPIFGRACVGTVLPDLCNNSNLISMVWYCTLKILRRGLVPSWFPVKPPLALLLS